MLDGGEPVGNSESLGIKLVPIAPVYARHILRKMGPVLVPAVLLLSCTPSIPTLIQEPIPITQQGSTASEMQTPLVEKTAKEVFLDYINNPPGQTGRKFMEANTNDKIRMLNTMLQQDTLNETPYIAQDNGPDVDGDGIVELTTENGVLLNEAGKPILQNNFVCSDYSRAMARGHGLVLNADPISEKDKELPIVIVDSSTGYGNHLNEKKSSKHSFNAVFTGTSKADIRDIKKWFFFEPQSDEAVGDPFSHLIGNVVVITLQIPQKDGYDVSPLQTFVKMENQTIQSLDDVETQILQELEQWQLMQSYVISGSDDFVDDEPDLRKFEIGDIEDVVKAIKGSGFMTDEQLAGSLHDAKLPAGLDPSVFSQ